MNAVRFGSDLVSVRWFSGGAGPLKSVKNLNLMGVCLGPGFWFGSVGLLSGLVPQLRLLHGPLLV